MKASDFRVWQAKLGLSVAGAADALGKRPNAVSNYRRDGVPDRDEVTIRLAMAAVEAGIAPWSVSK